MRPLETPSPGNSLGVKGVGRPARSPATSAIVNSVIDALRPSASTSSTCRSPRTVDDDQAAREVRSDPRGVRPSAQPRSTGRWRAARRRRGREAALRRPLAAAADGLRLARRRCSSTSAACRTWRASSAPTAAGIGAMTSPRRWRASALGPRSRGHGRRPAGPALGPRLAHLAAGLRPARDPARLRGSVVRGASGKRFRSRRPTCSRTTSPPRSARTRCSRRSGCPRWTATGSLPQARPPQGGLVDGGRGHPRQEGRRQLEDVGSALTPHELHAACGRPRPSRRCAADRRRGSIAAAAEQAAEGTQPPAGLSASADYRHHAHAHQARASRRRGLIIAPSAGRRGNRGARPRARRDHACRGGGGVPGQVADRAASPRPGRPRRPVAAVVKHAHGGRSGTPRAARPPRTPR